MGNNHSIPVAMTPETRALHIAVMRNDVPAVIKLIEAGADVNLPWVNVKNPSIKDGTTPLCEAVSLNHRQIAVMLLQHGVDVNLPDRLHCTPLHKAAYHGRQALTRILIDAGADVHAYDQFDNTPLHICVQNALVHNNTETVSLLINAGAKVNAINSIGKIPLHYAILWGLKDITDVLLKSRSEVDHGDVRQNTPLYCCMQALSLTPAKKELFTLQLPAIKLLIMAGCDTLNLATWLRVNNLAVDCPDLDFADWYESSIPERLKHLCRITIQKHLNYTVNDNEKIMSLPIPQQIKKYLTRKMFIESSCQLPQTTRSGSPDSYRLCF